MNQTFELKKKLNQELVEYYKNNRCEHSETLLKKRLLSNNSIQYVYQCMCCGKATSNAIKAEKALVLNNGIDPEPFDEKLGDTYYEEYRKGIEKIEDHYKTLIEVEKSKINEKIKDFNKWYKKYLSSDDWLKKRDKVLLRAQGICEGCRENEATVVHHTTYEHVGEEFLFELVALCYKCHARIHEKDDNAN